VINKSSSADVLENLGNYQPDARRDCHHRESGVGFMFAQPPPRNEDRGACVRRSIKTIFNILGPVTNPASAPNILMGVFHPTILANQVRALPVWVLSMRWWSAGAMAWTRFSLVQPPWSES
jgi:anthranilate phosphoribosyltransferase